MTAVSMDEIDTNFYLAYGRAMAHFAECERALCLMFTRITRLSPPIARAVFYSARSLQGRVEMVQAVIPFTQTIPAGRDFMVRATRIVMSWSGVRNRLAHDPHALHIETDPGEAGIRPTRIITTMKSAEPLLVEHLNRAALNFGFLAMLISISLAERTLLRDPELSLAALDLMPEDPAQTEIDLGKANPISMQIGRLPL